MSAGLYTLVDLAISAYIAKVERDAILAQVRQMEVNGSTAEQITQALRGMRDEAILKAQDEINRA